MIINKHTDTNTPKKRNEQKKRKKKKTIRSKCIFAVIKFEALGNFISCWIWADDYQATKRVRQMWKWSVRRNPFDCEKFLSHINIVECIVDLICFSSHLFRLGTPTTIIGQNAIWCRRNAKRATENDDDVDGSGVDGGEHILFHTILF